ncbi:hypothetical protein SUGI_1497840 [Cryptomeria japonica]|uniref:Uncharacterized protein n=1 Tax=Cryptomeria japonica TaxID=3369 RepID=A0AAD3NVW1_CRYJA|nr:hypothetical protein SUGI_1497840 [Cryptomeria japonica]
MDRAPTAYSLYTAVLLARLVSWSSRKRRQFLSGGIPGCSRAVGKAGAVLGPGEVEVPPPGVGAGAEVEEAGHPFHFDSQRERESRGWRWHSPVKESSEKAFTLRRDGMQEVASLPEHNGEALPLRVVLVLVTGIDPNLWDLRIPVLAHLPGHQRAIDLERILGEIGYLTASSTDASNEKFGGRALELFFHSFIVPIHGRQEEIDWRGSQVLVGVDKLQFRSKQIQGQRHGQERQFISLIRDQKHRREQVDPEADPIDSVDEANGSADSVDYAVVNAPPTPPYPSTPYAVVRDPAAEPVAKKNGTSSTNINSKDSTSSSIRTSRSCRATSLSSHLTKPDRQSHKPLRDQQVASHPPADLDPVTKQASVDSVVSSEATVAYKNVDPTVPVALGGPRAPSIRVRIEKKRSKGSISSYPSILTGKSRGAKEQAPKARVATSEYAVCHPRPTVPRRLALSYAFSGQAYACMVRSGLCIPGE